MKSFKEKTSMDVDGYPLYERINNIGKGYEKGDHFIVSGGNIVLYNPHLIKNMDLHRINIEVCAWICDMWSTFTNTFVKGIIEQCNLGMN